MSQQKIRGFDNFPENINPHLSEAIDSIDASVFNSDRFHDTDHLDHLDAMMSRWQRNLLFARQIAATSDSAVRARLAIATGQEPDIHAVFVSRARDCKYFLEVHPTADASKRAWLAYCEGSDSADTKPLMYIPCEFYIAPGYHDGKLINVVNEDDEAPDVQVDESLILADQADQSDRALYGILTNNSESRKIGLIVYETRKQAQDFYFINRHRPTSGARAFVADHCAVAMLVSERVEEFPTTLSGRDIVILNLADVVEEAEDARS